MLSFQYIDKNNQLQTLKGRNIDWTIAHLINNAAIPVELKRIL